MFIGFHHVQLAMPAGEEMAARAFYGAVLGMTEIGKPPGLAARGGVWFRQGDLELHLGVQRPFRPARKAHPAFLVSDLQDIIRRLQAAGYPATPDTEFPGFERVYTGDVFGNRLEFLQHTPVPKPSASGPAEIPLQQLRSPKGWVNKPQRRTPMTTNSAPSDAYRVMQRIFEEGFAIGNDSVVDEVCAPDLLEHQFGTSGVGAEAIEHVKASIRDVHGAFPDIRFTIEDSVESGDVIWVRVRGNGTASGPYFGPPSGRQIDFTVIDIARVVDHRIVEHWGVPDRFAVLVQTGVLDRLAG